MLRFKNYEYKTTISFLNGLVNSLVKAVHSITCAAFDIPKVKVLPAF